MQLSLDLATTTALTGDQRSLALHRLAPSLAGTVLTIAASEHRSQRRNRRAARDRLAALLRDALAPDSVRRPTRPTRGSRVRSADAKRRRSQTKADRKRPDARE